MIKGLRGGLERSALEVSAGLVILEAFNDLTGIVIDGTLSIELNPAEHLLLAKPFANQQPLYLHDISPLQRCPWCELMILMSRS